jgi:hypothetical protein
VGAFTINNDPGALHYFFFSSISGSPIKDFPFYKSSEVPLARLCEPDRFSGMLLPVCLKDFPRFTTLTRRLFVRELQPGRESHREMLQVKSF